MRFGSLFISAVTLICLLPCSVYAQQDIPRLISYQGVLTYASGKPLAGPQTLKIGLYVDPSGGTALYTETHNTVPLDLDGVFSISIGSQNPIGSQLPSKLSFDRPYWLAVAIGTANLEQAQRTQLTAAP